MTKNRRVLARTLGPGHFPHQFAWLIDNPLRRLLLTPAGLADRLPLAESSVVLEIGPGSGYFSVELARRLPKGRLELVDLQAEMLAKARRKLHRVGARNVGFTSHDAGAGLPFRSGVFDVAVLIAVLGEISEPQSCLRELLRVLRPGGVVAIHEHVPDPDRIPQAALRLLVEGCGFGFHRYWGNRWNYTAVFEVPSQAEAAALCDEE